VATMAKPNKASGRGSSGGLGHTQDAVNHEFEMAEHSSPLSSATATTTRHVYANPNYPTMEIGGLPFYLTPTSTMGPLGRALTRPSSTTTGSSTAPPSSSQNERDAHLIGRSGLLPVAHHHEPGYGDSVHSGGPIYEDIDRMCSYRGAPPEMSPVRQTQTSRYSRQSRHTSGKHHKEVNEAGEERTYYNVSPKGDSGSSDVTSSPRPNHGGNTSSSEISFESISSPRHAVVTAEDPMRPNVIVNPSASPAHRRTLGTSSNRGSPWTPPVSSPSVYYYSDTLRPRRPEGNDEHGEHGVDPNALPSMRLAALASSPSGSSRRCITSHHKKRTALL